MNGFNVKDGKVTRNLSCHETIYLDDDVRYFFTKWKEYYQDIIDNTPAETRKPYEDSLSVVKVLEKDFFS